MPRRKKPQPEGAPEWMATYADMMTLLLCFFVLIVSFSEIKEEDKFQTTMEEIKQAFGHHGGGGRLPTDEDPALSLLNLMETGQTQRKRLKNTSEAPDPGEEGRHRRVTRVREGERFVVGGRVGFEPGSARLSPSARRKLRATAEQVRGEKNLIELRGHAATAERGKVPAGSGSRGEELWRLSYNRAKAVMRYLTSDPVGMRAERFRLIANADNEPVVERAYSTADQTPNRRVEVLVSESLIRDFDGPPRSRSQKGRP